MPGEGSGRPTDVRQGHARHGMTLAELLVVTWRAAMCDGSVRTFSYSVDHVKVLRPLANRRDGQVVHRW